jgi:hypothetical protein
MDDISLENKYKVNWLTTIRSMLDAKNEQIMLFHETKMNDELIRSYTEIINLKEKLIRNALIALGWTPPKEKQDEIEM